MKQTIMLLLLLFIPVAKSQTVQLCQVSTGDARHIFHDSFTVVKAGVGVVTVYTYDEACSSKASGAFRIHISQEDYARASTFRQSTSRFQPHNASNSYMTYSHLNNQGYVNSSHISSDSFNNGQGMLKFEFEVPIPKREVVFIERVVDRSVATTNHSTRRTTKTVRPKKTRTYKSKKTRCKC